MASPARSADQPQAPCSQSTIDRSIAPKAAREEDGDERRPREAGGAEERGIDERVAGRAGSA